MELVQWKFFTAARKYIIETKNLYRADNMKIVK